MKKYHPLFMFLFLVFSSLTLASGRARVAQGTGFIFFGDFGTGSSSQYQVARGMKSFCEREICNWGLLLGDNFYPFGVQSVNDSQWKTKFVDPYSPLQMEFHPVLGNHDYEGDIVPQIKYSQKNPVWNMPARYYSWSSGQTALFAIDTENFDVEQQKWLKSEIEKSKEPWKVVYGHRPIYSYGEHGDTDYLIRDLLPVIEGKADFYLSGHDHDLQVITKGKLNQIVSGAAAKIRPTKSGPYTLFSRSELGFSHLQIEGNTATLKVLNSLGKEIFTREYIK